MEKFWNVGKNQCIVRYMLQFSWVYLKKIDGK